MVVLGLIQMRCVRSREENINAALRSIADAAGRGAQIICLPELFLSPYFCQRNDDRGALETAESIPGPTTKALADAAKANGVVLVGGSLLERGNDGRFYNTAPVFSPNGDLLGTYRKTHIPEDPCYHEQHYFSPGDTGIRVFETPCARIAPLICYDQWFPEAARIAALKGAELIVYPTAIGLPAGGTPDEGDWRNAWETVQRGHAIANNIFVAAVNRAGREGALDFFGGSFVSDAFGNVIARAGKDEETVIAACDFATIGRIRDGWGFFRNRRPERYGMISGTPKSNE